MENADSSIDYIGFKGAGGPGAPPPPNPRSNPDRARYLTSLSCVVMMGIALGVAAAVYSGSLYVKFVIVGLLAGATVAACDWMLEVYAYVN